MDEEEQWTQDEEQTQEEQEMSTAERMGATLGGGIRSVLSGAGSVVSHLTRPLPRVVSGLTSTAPPLTIMPVPQPPPEATGAEDLSDLFEGPDMDKDNDVYIDDLVTFDDQDAADLLEVDDEDIFGKPGDIEDATSVSRADIMGSKPKPKPRLMRTSLPYYPGITGMR